MQFLKFLVPLHVCVARRTQTRADVMFDSDARCPKGTKTATMQYTRAMVRAPITSDMPQCAVWDIDDIGKKLPDECCDASMYPSEAQAETDAEPDNRIRNDGWTKCYVRERASGGSWVRNYVGCEDGELVAAEGCQPEKTGRAEGDLDTYPMTNEEFADAQNANGTFDSCGCELPAKYVGEGCFAALNSKAFGIPGANDMVNYVQVALGKPSRPNPRPVRKPVWARPAPKPVLSKPSWSIPKGGSMQYYFWTRDGFYDESKYDDPNAFTAKSHPQCDIPWGDIDDSGDFDGYNLIGSKMPDSCCSELIQTPPEQLKDPQGNQATCYLHEAAFPGWPAAPDTKWMRLYLGCEDGQLVGAENCVPKKDELYDKDTFEAGTYTYPMDKAVADQTWKNSTPDGCGCSKRSRFNNGPGCYLAYATAFDYGMKFKMASSNRGIVFVHIDGQCAA